ncbi:MAG: hypothetical protein ABI461_00145, partial [Polyangiaceae bacterium]
ASFFSPQDVAADDSGNLYVADSGNGLVRKITGTDGQLTVEWKAPAGADAKTLYTAAANASPGVTRSCSVTGLNSCVIGRLLSKISYVVSVTATTAAGTSVAAQSAPVTPN